MPTPLQLKIGPFKNGETNEEFPNKMGGRCKVDIESILDNALKGKVESIVLTLFKMGEGDANKNFSLSIKLNKELKITSSELNEPIYGENKYIYKNTEDSITKLYNLPTEDFKYTHILIIGTAVTTDVVNTSFTFTANKSIFVTNTTESPQTVLEDSGGTFQNLLTIEEFLNLRYIDYFSFDNEKFNQLYKGIPHAGGGISKKKNKSK